MLVEIVDKRKKIKYISKDNIEIKEEKKKYQQTCKKKKVKNQ